MALARIKVWVAERLRFADLNGEIDNILNNSLSLISPLTGNLDFNNFRLNNLGAGSLGQPAINFSGNTNTGIYSPASNQVATVVAGVAAANFTAAAAGPHVIGSGTTNTRYALNHTGTITLSGATQEAGFGADQALTNASGVNLYGMFLNHTLTNVAGATTDMGWLVINPSALTITAGSVTNASGLKIIAAPSGATNNFALWVAGGLSRFQGDINADGGVLSFVNVATGAIRTGSTALQFTNAAGGSERMRLTDSGIFLIGTTVTTGAAAGDISLANLGVYRAVNAAGTGSVSLIGSNASNQVSIASGGSDIRWGTALVALGGGAAPTFGTIGGAGPATAAQNTWMRAIDSTGAAFWVPVWK